MVRIGIGILTGALCVVGSALAQPAPSADGLPAQPQSQIFVSKINPGATLNRFVEALRQEFRQLDADLDGDLTAADADLHEAISRAQMRAVAVMTIARADLDGDGFVTMNELRRVLRYDGRMNQAQPPASALEAIELQVRRLMAADADGDGRISLAEAFANKNWAGTLPSGNALIAAQLVNPMGGQIRQLVAADPDGGGKVDFAKFEALGTAIFRRVDTDGNGTISQDEINDYRKRETDAARGQGEAAARAACTMPKASDAATLVVLSAQRSEAISTVGLGSQDVKIGTTEIKVEGGPAPLYVVVVSVSPTIWRVTGDTARIEQLVA